MNSAGLIFNTVTLNGIIKSFNIRTHVFLLLFLDSLISTLGSAVSTRLHAMVLADLLPLNHTYCFIAFIAFLIPSNLGQLLNMMISTLRFYLTTKSAKNIQPSKSKVTFYSVAIFVSVALINISYITINEVLDIPYAIHIEACDVKDKEPRFSICHILSLCDTIFCVYMIQLQ